MSTIEFTCSNCSKTYRVRSEFAGKSTHCPGCSKPVRIGGLPPAAPTLPKREKEADTSPRRPINDSKKDNSIPSAEWNSLRRALKREHRSITLLGISILMPIVLFPLWLTFGRGIFAYSLLGLATLVPLIFLMANMLIARLDAMKVPEGIYLERTARAARNAFYPSIACFIALTLMMTLGAMERRARQVGSPFHTNDYALPFFGFLFLMMWCSLTASMTLFTMLIAQVGIRLQSAAISRQIANMAASIDLFLFLTSFLVLGGGIFFVLQTGSGIGPFLMTILGGWLFILQVVLTLKYRRLLEIAQDVVGGKVDVQYAQRGNGE